VSLRTAPSVPQPFVTAQKGLARTVLPVHLFDLGMVVLKNEDTLDAVIANTNFHNVTYAKQPLYMRTVNGEGWYNGTCCHFGTLEEDVYGLGSLGTLEPNEHGMLSMIDAGGNVGVATIAAFKWEPQKMRIVAVEPVPSTYFLLVYNLWLNGVPNLSMEQFLSSPTQPGVLALNKGISQTDNSVLGLCYAPPFSMNAKICECSAQSGELQAQQPGVAQCANVVSTTFPTLLNYFGNGNTQLSFLKMDCEGCESNLLPDLTTISQNPAFKLGRLAGELHAVDNTLEDLACKFATGSRVEHICNMGETAATANFVNSNLTDRCLLGATRKNCVWP